MKNSNGRATRTETVTTRLAPDVLAAARIVAQTTGRTVSGLSEYALRRFIEKNYPEAFNPGARISITTDDAPEEQERT